MLFGSVFWKHADENQHEEVDDARYITTTPSTQHDALETSSRETAQNASAQAASDGEMFTSRASELQPVLQREESNRLALQTPGKELRCEQSEAAKAKKALDLLAVNIGHAKNKDA